MAKHHPKLDLAAVALFIFILLFWSAVAQAFLY